MVLKLYLIMLKYQITIKRVDKMLTNRKILSSARKCVVINLFDTLRSEIDKPYRNDYYETDYERAYQNSCEEKHGLVEKVPEREVIK